MFFVILPFLDTLLPGYCPWGAGGHTPTQRRNDAKTRSVRRKFSYEMDWEDTANCILYDLPKICKDIKRGYYLLLMYLSCTSWWYALITILHNNVIKKLASYASRHCVIASPRWGVSARSTRTKNNVKAYTEIGEEPWFFILYVWPPGSSTFVLKEHSRS
jgi:hypothetical protein